jgi:hypothetical protein
MQGSVGAVLVDVALLAHQQSVYSLFAGLFRAPAVGWAAQGLAALIAAWVVVRAWRSPIDHRAKIAVLIAATPLAAPYLYEYDLVMLIWPIVWLARLAARGWERAIIGMAFIMPFAAQPIALAGLGVNPGAMANGLLLFAVARRALAMPPTAARPVQGTPPA